MMKKKFITIHTTYNEREQYEKNSLKKSCIVRHGKKECIFYGKRDPHSLEQYRYNTTYKYS